MVKSRSALSPSVREKLLREYRHRCAMCGADRPQIHHIDEDPSNNHLLNLLPLCPNHHLTDQHDPTAQVNQNRLALFRKYKDPQILSPQFEPVFNRLEFLLSEQASVPSTALVSSTNDLVRFIAVMPMGQYYSGVVQELLDSAYLAGKIAAGPVAADAEALYRGLLWQNSARAVQLVVEQLRYQSWPPYAG